MIKHRRGKATARLVTKTAILRCRYVSSGVLTQRAGGVVVYVTAIATLSCCDGGMVKRAVSKVTINAMTRTAIFAGGCGNMRCRLTQGIRVSIASIMTRGAIIGDACMTKDRCLERITDVIGMANIAILRRWDVIRCRIHAERRREFTIVTPTAAGDDGRVNRIIKRGCGSKAATWRAIHRRTIGCIVVTLAAIIHSGNMI